MISKQYLRRVEFLRDTVPDFDTYPFNLDIVRNLQKIDFHPKVTFLVGENGSGKSTLLEAISVAWGFNPEGGSKHLTFQTRDSHSQLWDHLRLIKGAVLPRDGFFLRAESFYNMATAMEQVSEGVARPLDKLHSQSHGESFWTTFTQRFSGNALYILDEPEAALSPSRQLAFLTRLHELVGMKSQFIIATHSPIIMAYPNAAIHQLTEGCMEKVSYRETDHYVITTRFLNNPERLLGILLEG